MRQDSPPATRILLVEDDGLVAADIAEEVKSKGMHVVGSPDNLGAALEAVTGAADFDLAILDINLAGETVYPVADELAARDLPFVFLSAYERGFIPPAHSRVPRFSKPLTRSAMQAMLLYLNKFVKLDRQDIGWGASTPVARRERAFNEREPAL